MSILMPQSAIGLALGAEVPCAFIVRENVRARRVIMYVFMIYVLDILVIFYAK
jgi:hypothetical protein